MIHMLAFATIGRHKGRCRVHWRVVLVSRLGSLSWYDAGSYVRSETLGMCVRVQEKSQNMRAVVDNLKETAAKIMSGEAMPSPLSQSQWDISNSLSQSSRSRPDALCGQHSM